MNNDNQHLDFLISQHVDGCLDAAGKKSVEQRLMSDPDARKLYQEHRDVQDVLDDWGSRIPMINWDEFDQKLATRLEKETVGAEKQGGFWGGKRKWYKPVAAAAALFVAASLGYGWHGVSGRITPVGPTGPAQVASVEGPSSSVTIEGGRTVRATSSQFGVVEPLGMGVGSVASGKVEVIPPGDVAAVESLKDAVMSGLSNVADGTATRYNLQSKPGSASAMNGFEQKHSDEEGGLDREGMAPLP